jgi:diketogulonate reductase-like aldo/keto reductase
VTFGGSADRRIGGIGGAGERGSGGCAGVGPRPQLNKADRAAHSHPAALSSKQVKQTAPDEDRGRYHRLVPLMRPIPSTGESVPAIGLGTWQTFDVGASAHERAPLEDVLRTFVAAGGTLIDSSPMYGRAEEVVGDLATATDVHPQLFIATKVWTSGKAEGIRQMEASMRKLRSSRLHLVQVHNLLDVDTHLDTLEEWQREGRVRYIGITHYVDSAHEAVARVLTSRRVDFVQINYSAADRAAERLVLPLARDRGVAVLVNRPFVEGALLRRLGDQPLPEFASEIDCRSWSELLLKFVISHPAVTCAIPATSSAAHLRDNMRAADGPMPDPALRERIAVAIS